MNLLEETQMLLRQYGVKAKKSYGQNFLIEQSVLEEMVEKAKIGAEDTVLEIGPGLGSLTKVLLQKAKRVIAVELDEEMVSILKQRFSEERLTICQKDILKMDLAELTKEYGTIKVVANLPYYITTPILMKLLEEKQSITSITVMVQREVGERICAKPGSRSYGAITVSVQYYAIPQMLLTVPKENFLPMPEVDSCVIQLTCLSKPPVTVVEEKRFFRLVKATFSQRRKTISNSLAAGEFSKEAVQQTLQTLQIDGRLRAEELSLEDFARIANQLMK